MDKIFVLFAVGIAFFFLGKRCVRSVKSAAGGGGCGTSCGCGKGAAKPALTQIQKQS